MQRNIDCLRKKKQFNQTAFVFNKLFFKLTFKKF